MRRAFPLLLFCATIAPAQDGQALFQTHCATCHNEHPADRTPRPEALTSLTSTAIVSALTTGAMRAQGAALSPAERVVIARFLSKVPDTGATPTSAACSTNPPLRSAAGWNGWGVDLANTRFQPPAAAGLSAAEVPRLKLRWAFGVPNTTTMLGQPTVAGGRVFFGAADGTVYSLDQKTGCTHWTYKAAGSVRSAITVAPLGSRFAAYFGDVKANAYALDASTGALIWQTRLDDHPAARVTGAPKLYEGRLYVPLSSIEEVYAGGPKYACCKFRGSVVALDAATGQQAWKAYAIPDPPAVTGKSVNGVEHWGPSGAAIWSSPTIDAKRKLLYVGTGDQYSGPATAYSDAVVAFDLETGSLRWARQLTNGDAWNFACFMPDKSNCPESPGEDTDFGSSPILVHAGRRDLLLCGQKSGVMHALDPARKGAVVWQTRIGHGGALGGIMWGSASDGRNVYVPLSDYDAKNPLGGGGLFALSVDTGEAAWRTPAPHPACEGKAGCSAAQMAPASAIGGVVFSGSMDGHLRAYSTADGSIVWDFDTLRPFNTVNGVKASGGSLNATGPTIANGIVLVNSGYAVLGGMPGNVLLAFSAE